MTSPFSSAGRSSAKAPRLPTQPSGWPIGAYDTYQEAQRSVEFLASKDFPVPEVTIVGVNLMLVERVVARLSWGRALGAGAASGAWFGLFVGVLLSFFSSGSNPLGEILVGLGIGIVFGLIFAGVGYASARGQRDFSSTSQLVAGRYDVLCSPKHAELGRNLLAQLSMRPNPGQGHT
ncbi:MAG: general stress protein [Sciscionella sp.]